MTPACPRSVPPGPTGNAGRGSSVRYRSEGMQRDLRGAAKSWVWLLIALPRSGRGGRDAVSGCARSPSAPADWPVRRSAFFP